MPMPNNPIWRDMKVALVILIILAAVGMYLGK
jgi:hypothetical protein